MQASAQGLHELEPLLQLLLFVDKRPKTGEQIREIRSYLKSLEAQYPFDLQIVDVGEQPYLAEHFKLVATPALIKIHPEPRQILAGTDLITKLIHWFPRWQRSVEDYLATKNSGNPPSALANSSKGSVVNSAELIQLSDEIFCLKQEKEALQEQLQFKDRIIAMLAHDLRNPLTAASIALETLEMGINAEETGGKSRLTPALKAQLLKHARTQTRTIDRMITDILQAARGSQAELQIQFQELELGKLCEDVLNNLHGQFEAKSQILISDIPKDLPRVYADQERVRQVIVNLLDNAIKYTPKEGSITVSILHRTTQKVQVSICDTGPGVPEDNRDLIFQDHFRLQRDKAQEGYGIGLSVCQRIIRAHYGQIWVDSGLERGSCFHFTLPVFRK
ncbi:MAG: histidine kinase [Leptolyngbyaceae cyanobacterium bins.59]|nr:histidine kinase [Leptolyngbyaceae cyanobacterium bins.59]